MDILYINQKDDDARVAVTQHIPTIFKLARKTITIRESTSCRAYYTEAVERSRTSVMCR